MTAMLNRKLESLQKNVENIRNICILAHVDHGKTTLADSLVAANGVISTRLAGKLRYMDSRKDEQERGITMKSSAIALYPNQEKEFLINLMDSPGHVDFSSEVCTAVRLCDGAVVVVDVVEGVQPQTKVVLQQAWDQGMKPILVLNKIDRLMTETKLDPSAAYFHISQVLEQVNAVMGELFTTQVMSSTNQTSTKEFVEFKEGDVFDWSSGLEESDDSQLYFCPEQGNVIFASAYDGWAFSIETFADIFSKKLNFSPTVLRKTLWGDYYLNMKEKKIMKGAHTKNKKPLFVQLILDNIWMFYQTIMVDKDKPKLEKMIQTLGLKISPRDLRSTDSKQLLSSVMSTWLPIASSVLSMVCNKLPPPSAIGSERSKKLMCPQTKKFDTLPVETRRLLADFEACSSDDSAPKIVFVSKMFPVTKSQMPGNRAKPLTEEELALRREGARARHQERLTGTEGAVQLTTDQLCALDINKPDVENKTDLEFIAFARVFSGNLKAGDEIFVLGPKYDPSKSGTKLEAGEFPDRCHASKATVTGVFMLLGRDLESIEVAEPGNVIGISGLANSVIKSATLCSTPWCPPFVELVQSTYPILRVAIEPARSSDIQALSRGLQLLNQADAHVEVMVSEVGENLLLTAGEVHLQRCILDLTESYAKCEVMVSDPIVPFRETIVPNPETDMVNEAIEGENRGNDEEDEEKDVELETPNKQSVFRIRAIPLPSDFTKLLQDNVQLIKALGDKSNISSQTQEDVEKLKEEMKGLAGTEDFPVSFIDKILSFGPRRTGPNILVNLAEDLEVSTVWTEGPLKTEDKRRENISNLVNGFQLATLAGPLCEEPMMGVGFILESWVLREEGESGWGPLSGQIVSTFKEGCRRCFQKQPQRLVTAMYTCEISVKAEVLGRLYGVINRRRGQIVKEDLVEGSSTFTVTAHIPVIESLDLSSELRKQTSGLAMPQLVFTHWEVLDVDPFWEPQTEEELLHFGEKADSENPARLYMNNIKRRKGLKIDEKLVEFAEKQRTLTKSK